MKTQESADQVAVREANFYIGLGRVLEAHEHGRVGKYRMWTLVNASASQEDAEMWQEQAAMSLPAGWRADLSRTGPEDDCEWGVVAVPPCTENTAGRANPLKTLRTEWEAKK